MKLILKLLFLALIFIKTDSYAIGETQSNENQRQPVNVDNIIFNASKTAEDEVIPQKNEDSWNKFYIQQYYKVKSEFLKVKLEDEIWVRKHHVKVFTWQLYKSLIIFSVVNILILFGLYLSYLQFKKKQDDSRTRIILSKNGIEIDSSVIGLLILFLSLGFFYLYIAKVFPIKSIEVQTKSNTIVQEQNISNKKFPQL